MNCTVRPEKTTVLEKINSLASSKEIVPKNEILSVCKKANDVLKSEVTEYREALSGSDGIPGGLIDFVGRNESDVIVVPDLHARRNLIPALLSHAENGIPSVFERLCRGKLKIVFLGDILHSEGHQKARWQEAFCEYGNGTVLSEAMTEEMTDGLSTLMQIMLLKTEFPESVHCLKGNHENIKNENENGNHSFYKFVREGSMVFDFMYEQYGLCVISEIAGFESRLPLACFFDNFIVSHAEPACSYSRQDIVNSVCSPDVVEGLTWTRNGDVLDLTAVRMLEENCAQNGIEKKYITGHRPVSGMYALRQNGALVQIHNPGRMQAAFVKNGCAFEPETDIFEL